MEKSLFPRLNKLIVLASALVVMNANLRFSRFPLSSNLHFSPDFRRYLRISSFSKPFFCCREINTNSQVAFESFPFNKHFSFNLFCVPLLILNYLPLLKVISRISGVFNSFSLRRWLCGCFLQAFLLAAPRIPSAGRYCPHL